MNTEPMLDNSQEDEIDLLSLLQVIAENLRLLILGPLLIGLAALGVTFVIPPTFTANTVFMPPQQQQGGAAMMLQSLGALGGLAGAAAGIKNPNDQYVSLMKSDTVSNALIARFNLVERYEAKTK
jgi:tyrosine-protein kinase Etk/Wzc